MNPLGDLVWDGHQVRQDRENYDWLVNNGVSHELALEQLGWDEKRWEKLLSQERRQAGLIK